MGVSRPCIAVGIAVINAHAYVSSFDTIVRDVVNAKPDGIASIYRRNNMSEWNQSEFLQDVTDEFKDTLNNKIELQTDWWCTASEEWLADEIITQLEEDLDDDWVSAVSEVVIKKAMWTNDCWDICRAIIGAGDFADYRDCASEPSNIN